MKRRKFIHHATLAATGMAFSGILPACTGSTPAPATKATPAVVQKPDFEISLAEWSLNRLLFAGKMTNLDFPVKTRQEFGIGVVEYVDQFFKDEVQNKTYLNELLKRCNDNGIKNHLIMVDTAGPLGEQDKNKRQKAIENHYKWIECAKFLGCDKIRTNAYGEGSAEEVQKAVVESLTALAEFGAPMGISVVVENHGSYSSNGQWLAAVMRAVNRPNCGTLPDFGNFCIKRDEKTRRCTEEYDRYQGIAEMMPFAKAVSAKTEDFDPQGFDTRTDYYKMMKIVKDSGFKGYVGIEYGGENDSPESGVMKTKALLEKVIAEI